MVIHVFAKLKNCSEYILLKYLDYVLSAKLNITNP